MADEIETTKPAETDERGRAMVGGYPLNHRLRAEALATAGKATDADNIVSDAVIADAGERLARNKAAEDEALDLSGKRKAELEAIAEAEGVDLAEAKNNDDRVRLIEEARAKRETEVNESGSDNTDESSAPPPVGDGGTNEEG